MKQSEQRILTTHVGSLPRARELSDLLIADEARQPIDHARLEVLAAEGVQSVVARQVGAGLDVINDGEQPRVGFQTYVSRRLEGFGGSSIREPFKDFADYPDFADIWVKRGMVMSKVFDAPTAQQEVVYKDLAPATRECDLFDAALAQQSGKYVEPFMTAASPGIVAPRSVTPGMTAMRPMSGRSPASSARNTNSSSAAAMCCNSTARTWRWSGTACSRTAA